MLGKIIISIIFIPINALLLWTVNDLTTEHQSYKKALLASSLIFVISLLGNISHQGHGFHGTWIMAFIGGWHLKVVLSGFIMWLVYRYDWKSLLLMWFIWGILQIPFDKLQSVILNLPWDMMLQAF
ncbi:MAG: hypothetical protein U9P73_01395 [Candidatus Cloacimonadota bacterium]|nr:hypothetical protein [Candidatus Cloacimonadota bacterium]